MADPVWNRIHPLTILIELARAVQRLFLAFIIIGFNLFFGGGGDSIAMELVTGVLGFAVIIPALARYYTFGYAINKGKLLVRSGVITKNLRTIPLDRIQNINLTRNLLHRMLGLVDLEIETASSAKAEASISALTEEQAKILKAQLMREAPKLTSFVHEEKNKKVIYSPSNWELFLVGASENRLLAMIAALVGLSYLGPQLGDNIEQNAGQLQSVLGEWARGWVFGVMIVLGLFLFGWIVSIVSTFVKYYGFELTEESQGRLKRTYGLLTNIENVLPLRRVQTVVYRQNLLQKKLNICKLFVSTAGGFGGEKKDDGTPQVQQSPLLTPVLSSDAFPKMIKVVLPNADVSDPEWKPVSPKTILRHIRSTLIPALILGGAAGWWVALDGSWKFSWQNIAAPFAILLIGLFTGYIHSRYAKWALIHDIVISRTGWLSQRRNYLPTDKVQAVTVRQSPIQRAFGLSTIDFSSAAPTFQNTEIDDLTAQDAESLAYAVHERSRKGHDTLVDGF